MISHNNFLSAKSASKSASNELVLASILVLISIILFIQKRPKGLFPQKGRAAE